MSANNIGRIVVLLLAFCCGQVAATSLPPPSALVISGGDQWVQLDSPVASPIVLRIIDGSRRPVPGVEVTFLDDCVVPPPAKGYGSPCFRLADPADNVRVSDARGFVVVPQYVSTGSPGHAPIQFRFLGWIGSGSVNLLVVSLTSPEPVAIEFISGPRDVELGRWSREPVAVRIIDGGRRPVPGVSVTFLAGCLGWNMQYPCAEPESPTASTDSTGIARVRFRGKVLGEGAYAAVWFNESWQDGDFIRLTFNVVTHRQSRATSASGTGEIALSIESDVSTCELLSFEPLGSPKSVNPRVAFPHGTARMRLRNCGSGKPVGLTLFHPGGVPEGGRLWVESPSWHATNARVSGFAPVEFTIRDGGEGDTDRKANGDIDAVVGIGYGDPDRPDFQDLWWSGAAESGWGMSIVQHGDMLFSMLFAYDASGRPTWFAMPGGRWNEGADDFSGALYSPRGKPLWNYDRSALVVGDPIGRASISFIDSMNADLEFEIGGVVTRKRITRQLFGPVDAGTAIRHGDQWWGGESHSGWGLVIHQQYSTLFGLLFTYGEDGAPTWIAMPSGFWGAADTFEGRAHRSRSSAWPKAYDASQLVSEDVGGFSLKFTDGKASFDYLIDGRRGQVELTRLPF